MLVCAPTGAGKTVVGEFGVHRALAHGRKAFYTTPIKALSNQKFGDFIARHGAANVGLLTGDNSINGEAPIVVMTTEVLRNMLYEDSPTLDGLGLVILDEVHYLQDRYRGATWEEVMIHLPPGVQVAALSATVSNPEEFGEWMRSVRGPTEVVVEHERPVPIEHSYLVGDTLHPMFVRDGDRLIANPALRRMRNEGWERRPPGSHRGGRSRQQRGGRRPRHQGGRRHYRPDRVEVIQRLHDEDLLPAITFIFSRAGCERAVEMCRAARLDLTTPEERERIAEYVELRTKVLGEQDLAVLGYESWLEGLLAGIAAHHAGMIPLFKETVEELFERALVKAVFATETLALGINMPARTVVLERLVKFNGEKHEMMTPGDFSQLTGRAGRRGIDDVGFGVVVYQKDIGFDRIAQLAEARSFPLGSSFRPSYNMAVNLLRHHSVEESTRLLNLSFAQFLRDRGVVEQERAIERNEEFIASYKERARCDRGDVLEYWSLLRRAREAQDAGQKAAARSRGEAIRDGMAALRRGHVVVVDRGPRAGLAAIVEVRTGKHGEPQPLALTEDRRLGRLGKRDFREAPIVVGTVQVPRGNPRAPKVKHAVADALAKMERVPPRPAAPQQDGPARRAAADAVRAHPVHDCPDRADHERWMERVDPLERETQRMRSRVRKRTGTLGRTFRRIMGILDGLGYLAEGDVTAMGERLARIYNESDLLLSESIRTGAFDGLSGPEVAALASVFVYETRVGMPELGLPTAKTGEAYSKVVRIGRRLVAMETDEHLELTREPDPGFARAVHRWASGADLEDVLDMGEWSPGDFVRSSKQVWDLLRQIQDLDVDEDLTARCREAARGIYRGVVAASGTL